MSNVRIVLLGGGGHASDVLGVLEDLRAAGGPAGRAEVVGLVADDDIDRHRFAGRGVEHIGRLDDLSSIDATHYVLAVEWPAERKALFERVAGSALEPATLVHPTATIGAGVQLGPGTVVFAGAHVSPMVQVGAHATLSNHCVIGYSATLGDFVTVMPAGVVSGDTVLGDGATIGTNATVIEGVKIGESVILGAGAVAVAYVPPGVTAIGVPATWKK